MDDDTYKQIMSSLEERWKEREVSYYVKPRENMWRSCCESRRSICVYVNTDQVWEVYKECDFCLWLRKGNVEIQERRTMFNQYWDPVSTEKPNEITVIEFDNGSELRFSDEEIIFTDPKGKVMDHYNYKGGKNNGNN